MTSPFFWGGGCKKKQTFFTQKKRRVTRTQSSPLFLMANVFSSCEGKNPLKNPKVILSKMVRPRKTNMTMEKKQPWMKIYLLSKIKWCSSNRQVYWRVYILMRMYETFQIKVSATVPVKWLWLSRSSRNSPPMGCKLQNTSRTSERSPVKP